jgi:hypothetical protein
MEHNEAGDLVINKISFRGQSPSRRQHRAGAPFPQRLRVEGRPLSDS